MKCFLNCIVLKLRKIHCSLLYRLTEEKNLHCSDWIWNGPSVVIWVSKHIRGEIGALKTTFQAEQLSKVSQSTSSPFTLSLYIFFRLRTSFPNSNHSISIYFPPPFAQPSHPILPFSHLRASTPAIKPHSSRSVPEWPSLSFLSCSPSHLVFSSYLIS